MNNDTFPCWINGNILEPSQALISIYDHGLLYGDGCFEGLRFHHKKPFRLEQHLARLHRSLRSSDITIPYTDRALEDAVIACINESRLTDGYIRILVTRGDGDMGLNPRNCGNPNVFIIPALLSLVSEDAREKGIRLITSSIRRAVGTGLDTRVKSLNYLHSILARIEANSADVDEAILLNQFGHVAECSAANIFLFSNNALLTPSLRDGALEGITRRAILELAADHSIVCRETSLNSYDLYNADECFICGSGAQLVPVKSIDGRKMKNCPGPFYKWAVDSYQKLVYKECRGER